MRIVVKVSTPAEQLIDSQEELVSAQQSAKELQEEKQKYICSQALMRKLIPHVACVHGYAGSNRRQMSSRIISASLQLPRAI